MSAKALLYAALPDQFASVRSQLVLPDGPMRFDVRSEKVLIMLFAARAGSTYAGQLLEGHPAFGRMAEWFNPKRLEMVRTKDNLADDAAAVQAILDAQGKTVFGAECTSVGLISCAILGALDQLLPKATFVVLRRRDTVAQAVSLHKARLTGRFSSNQKAQRAATEDDFDFAAIAHHRAIIEQVYAHHETALALLEREANTYYYEDVVADPAAFQRAIYRELDLDVPEQIKATARIAKVGDAINEAWIARFREMESASG